jgi:hypothetical protein
MKIHRFKKDEDGSILGLDMSMEGKRITLIYFITWNLQQANETNDNVGNAKKTDVKFTGKHITRLAPASSDEI